MDRRAVSRGIRRLSPFMVLVVVLGLLAGGIALLASQPSASSRGGLSIQAPGSNGSVHSLPWWDPRGWFGGGGGGSSAPSARVLADNASAVPFAGRMPRQAALGPVHRVRGPTAPGTDVPHAQTGPDGKRQTAAY